MLVKRGFIFLIFLLLVNISYAQENQCLLVNENNIEEAAERIWNTFSSLGLGNALSAVDSLKPGDNGYEFKEELKEELRKKSELGCDPSEPTTLRRAGKIVAQSLNAGNQEEFCEARFPEKTVAQQIIDESLDKMVLAAADEESPISDVVPNPLDYLAEKIVETLDKKYPGLSEPLGKYLAILMLKNNQEVDIRGFEANKIIPEIVKKIRPSSNQYELDETIFALSLMNYLYFYGTDMFSLYLELVELSEERVNGQLSEREREIKERIALTVNPFGYESIYDLEKIDNFLLNKEQFDKDSVDDLSLNSKVRIDLFRKYLGLEQYYNFIVEARYNPPNNLMRFVDDNFRGGVYRFRTDGIVHFLKIYTSGGFIRPNVPLTFENFVEHYFTNPPYGSVPLKKNFMMRHPFFVNLQVFEFGIGYDEERKERYIYYFDYWDLDPPKLVKVGINIDGVNFPILFYDRIYESDFDEYLSNETEFSTYWGL